MLLLCSAAPTKVLTKPANNDSFSSLGFKITFNFYRNAKFSHRQTFGQRKLNAQVGRQIDGKDLLLRIWLAEQLWQKVEANVHRWDSSNCHRQEFHWVTLEVNQFGQIGVGDEGLVQIAAYHTTTFSESPLLARFILSKKGNSFSVNIVCRNIVIIVFYLLTKQANKN
jgi:hypothetical protein